MVPSKHLKEGYGAGEGAHPSRRAGGLPVCPTRLVTPTSRSGSQEIIKMTPGRHSRTTIGPIALHTIRQTHRASIE